METTVLGPEQAMPSDVETVLCDLDGVVWLAHDPIPGAVAAIAAARTAGCRVLFVTNNSAATRADHEAALRAIGVPAEGDVLSSAMAGARLIGPGERVLVSGGPGVVEAVEERGAEAVLNDGSRRLDDATYDVVIVGLHRDFDYQRLARAARALHGGARLIGTNSDTTYPTGRGLDPGGGSIVAAVAAAGETTPVFGGKPHPPMAALVAATVSQPGRPFDPARVLMVGDRPETDGLMARRIGCRFALVRTGVTSPAADLADIAAVESTDGDAPDPVVVDIDAPDLAGVIASITAGTAHT